MTTAAAPRTGGTTKLVPCTTVAGASHRSALGWSIRPQAAMAALAGKGSWRVPAGRGDGPGPAGTGRGCRRPAGPEAEGVGHEPHVGRALHGVEDLGHEVPDARARPDERA